MYIFILFIVFIFGLGAGVVVSGLRRKRGEVAAPAAANPFLDEADSEVADELRAEGAKVVQGRIERRKDRIVAKAKEEGRITNDGVEELFCISDNTAGNYLRQLVEEERLQKVGSTGRGVYYVAL
jgi:predicted HTH transcriptional regulator